MSIFVKLRSAGADPVMATYFAWSWVNSKSLFEAYRRRARAAGLDRAYFVLSFDCDTDDDIEVAWEVHERLLEMGIRAVYAVPGELLKKGVKAYERIAATGSEFLNHGYRRHTYFDTAVGDHRSCFFYDEQPRGVVAGDIKQGDIAVSELLGKRPRGFRAPHFGTFQKPPQLRFLHSVLKGLGYLYSTSTMPVLGFRFGPAFRDLGIWEMPVSGGVSRPLSVLDSWGCFKAPDRQYGPGDYQEEAVGIARRLADGPAIINLYADPSHIAGRQEFFDAMAEIKAMTVPATYEEILERLE